MARLARIVIPGLPHHVTQRGNRRQQTFFDDNDYDTYLRGLKQACDQFGVAVWAYCLMPNHVHLVVVPQAVTSLSKAMGRGHENYSRYLNHRMGWTGLLWQSRYRSFPMDDAHLYHAVKYAELNPVRAGLVREAHDYPWSSARAHLGHAADPLVDVGPMLDRVESWPQYLNESMDPEMLREIRRHAKSNLPWGSPRFLDRLEGVVGRGLRAQKPGRKILAQWGTVVRP